MEENKNMLVLSHPTRGIISPIDVAIKLAACGVPLAAIAEDVGLSDREVSIILNDEKGKFEIRHLQHKYFQHDPQKRFKAMATRAEDVAADLMDETQRPNIRLAAAQVVLDRAHGKPPQTLEVGTSTIRTLFEQLDKRTFEAPQRNAPVEEPVAREVFDVGEIRECDSNEVVPERQNPNDVDTWIDENL